MTPPGCAGFAGACPGCPECPFTGQREPIGRKPDAQTNPGRGSPGISNQPSGHRCGGCHTAANNGQNVAGQLFDTGVSRPEFARPDMAVYTFRRTSDGATLQTTDPGRGIRTGNFADLDHFKVPSLRGLAARAPYFHNGLAATLDDVVALYQTSLGFVFTPEEAADLVAFLQAL